MSAPDTMPTLQLGIIEFGSYQRVESTPGEVLKELIEDVIRAEELGFSRFWLGEHHTGDSPFGQAPEILIPTLTGLTESIRIGTGALLLRYYSPLKIAAEFKMLA